MVLQVTADVKRKGARGKAPRTGPETKPHEHRLTRRNESVRVGFGAMNREQSQGGVPMASVRTVRSKKRNAGLDLQQDELLREVG